MTAGARLLVTVAGDFSGLPDKVVMRINGSPLGMTPDQAMALAAALADAATRVDEIWYERILATSWRQNLGGMD